MWSAVLPAEGFITVNGKYGLRRAVELNVPGFYALRSGFTTGTCATAAAKAALLALTEECFEEKTEVTLPDGERVVLPIYKVEKTDENTATASVIKNAGDDPDVTHGHQIVATVSFPILPAYISCKEKGWEKSHFPDWD